MHYSRQKVLAVFIDRVVRLAVLRARADFCLTVTWPPCRTRPLLQSWTEARCTDYKARDPPFCLDLLDGRVLGAVSGHLTLNKEMGKRYFCDYCSRCFQDNLHSRKKHLSGVLHQRSKKAWYDFFRDTAAILSDEQNKKACRKFQQTGACDFGPNCRFSHMTEEDVQKMTEMIEEEKKAREEEEEAKHGNPDACIDDWLEKRLKKKKPLPGTSTEVAEAPVFQFPPGWPPVHELPPSLQPPPPEGWKVPASLQWG